MSNLTTLQTMQANQTMNSLQISELVKLRHDNVKRTIERLADQAVITLPQIEETSFIDKIGKTQHTKAYVFTGEQGKLDSITVVAQLCPNYTAKIVKRWQQLEHLVSSSDYQQTIQQNETLKTHILKQNPEYQTIKVMHDGGLQNSQIQLATNLAKSTVEKRLRTMRNLGLVGYKRGIVQQPQQPPQLALSLELEVSP